MYTYAAAAHAAYVVTHVRTLSVRLAWWKVECGWLPNLANLAKKYLCICGTSVPSERIFSTAGHIASRARGHLLPENVSKLLFLARNID